MQERLNGKPLVESEYRQDNYEFWLQNRDLADEIGLMVEGPIEMVYGFGSGEGLYEMRIANQFWADYELFDKRGDLPVPYSHEGRVFVTPDFIRAKFTYFGANLFVFANFLHVLKNPVDYLEALPKGAQVVIIDTFMAEPNSEWQLFFDNYMRQINGTRLPRMAKFESLPGWKVIAKKQNHGKYELGYLILRRVI